MGDEENLAGVSGSASAPGTPGFCRLFLLEGNE